MTDYLYERRYVSRRSGLTKVYKITQRRMRAPDVCRADLSRTDLHRDGNRWCSRSHRYQNATIERLIAAGHAVRDGDIVRTP